MTKNSAAKIAANRRYNEKTYDKITLNTPKGLKDKIKSAAEAAGMSMQSYIVQAVNHQLSEDRETIPPETNSGDNTTGD